MTIPPLELGAYSFLPYLRNGLAGLITAKEGETALRWGFEAAVSLSSDRGGKANLKKQVQLYGPGDVVGLDQRGIVRLEPRHWSTNFEPNYLAHIEFYDEDFPWRYTPVAPGNARLRPWITLVVLAEGEFKDDRKPEEGQTRPVQERLSPRIEFPDAAAMEALFPPADQLWAWAHVHVNDALPEKIVSEPGELNAVIKKLEDLLATDADLAYSRLICPRQLAADTAYHAFLVPSFESGRLAGLGLEPTLAPSATHSAWAPYEKKEAPLEIPYYYRWFFRTGGPGDFESLVRLLEAKPVDSRVGRRDMDVSSPGLCLPDITVLNNHVLRLGGALQVPASNYPEEMETVATYESWDNHYSTSFQEKLVVLINPPEAKVPPGAADVDPVITLPLYGRWHARVNGLTLPARGSPDSWVPRLNLDPRHRVTAGFGTRVVQQNQETYMEAAWYQIGDVLEANRLIRMAQLAKHVSLSLYRRNVVPLENVDPGRALMLTAPVLSRVVAKDAKGTTATLQHTVSRSTLPPAALSVGARRVLRPAGRARRLMPGAPAAPGPAAVPPFAPGTLLGQLSRGTLSAAPVRGAPAGALALAQWSATLRPNQRSAALTETIEFHAGKRRATDLSALRPVPNDSEETARFKTALRNAYAMVDASRARARPVARAPLDIAAVAGQAVTALDPARTIHSRLSQRVKLPNAIIKEIGEDLVEAMAYPVIDEPMYKPLSALSSELFLPNINLIPPNSVTLLETNQPFIEAYMVGVNHEFGRELLWREYPTDQRGSPFRQFWDATDALSRAVDTLDPATPDALEEVKDGFRDITRIHKWGKTTTLGSHNNRQTSNDPQKRDLVLVVRGELLKRYPTAVVYAHRAAKDAQGTRGLADPPTLEGPKANIRLPLYEAKVDPDIYFFGFDLTAEEVKGNNAVPEGWFFVIKERPGEPRFGLDTDQQKQINVWNDLSWADVPPPQVGGYIPIISGGDVIRVGGKISSEDEAQYSDDVQVTWDPSKMNAADVAYIMYQVPVLIAIHGAEMLRST